MYLCIYMFFMVGLHLLYSDGMAVVYFYGFSIPFMQTNILIHISSVYCPDFSHEVGTTIQLLQKWRFSKCSYEWCMDT